jgi:hypothetical protein
MAEQRELALLGIQAHQGADNLLHDLQLALRIAGIEFPTFDPRGITLAPKGEITLRLGNLLGEGVIMGCSSPLVWGARRRPWCSLRRPPPPGCPAGRRAGSPTRARMCAPVGRGT